MWRRIERAFFHIERSALRGVRRERAWREVIGCR
jgi:hypothetical protein